MCSTGWCHRFLHLKARSREHEYIRVHAFYNDDEHDETFSDWFTTNTGGGANFITDIIETSGKMWYIRGCGPTDTHADCIKWRFLFRSDIPTSTDNLRVYDVSFRTVMEGHGHGANVEGVFYEDNDGAGATDEIDVTLQIPYKGLVDCGAACGFICSIYRDGENDGQSDGPLSIYFNNGDGFSFLRVCALNSLVGLYL